MRNFAIAFVLVLLAGSAGAVPCGAPGAPAPPDCIDCALPDCADPDNCPVGRCAVRKYGLGADYNVIVDPLDTSVFADNNQYIDTPNHPDATFTGTFTYSRGETQEVGCDDEREFAPVFGQFLLRERSGCVPTDTTPCPVEFANDLWNPNDPSDPNRSWFGGPRRIYGEPELTGDNTNDVRLWISLGSTGQLNGRGERYAIPGGSQTRIKWVDVGTGGGGTTLCCNSDAPFNFCGLAGGGRWVPYPAINSLEADASPKVNFPDWIFQGGPGTAWETQRDYVVQGIRFGVCSQNRRWGCLDTEPLDSPTCKEFNNELWCDCDRDRCNGDTDSCYDHPEVACDPENDDPALDPCHSLPAASPGTCDIREIGWDMRADGGELLADFSRNPGKCGTAMYFWRGFPNQSCALGATYAVNGDPGADCWVLNYGGHFRPDVNCNGIADTDPDGAGPLADVDKCPFFSETNPVGDADLDGRGDECECADVAPLRTRLDGALVGDGNGLVNVSDGVAINNLIFTDPMADTLSANTLTSHRLAWPLCDATFSGGGECSRNNKVCANNTECAKNPCVSGLCSLNETPCQNDSQCANPVNTCVVEGDYGPSCTLSHTACDLGDPVGSCPNPFFPNTCSAGVSVAIGGTNFKCLPGPMGLPPECFGTCSLTGNLCIAIVGAGPVSCQDACQGGLCRFGGNSCANDAGCQNECVTGACNVSDLVQAFLEASTDANGPTCARQPVAGP
jgi:hypothetical protein